MLEKPKPPMPVGSTGKFDEKLGRWRTHTDDFYDHRELVLKRIDAAMKKKN